MLHNQMKQGQFVNVERGCGKKFMHGEHESIRLMNFCNAAECAKLPQLWQIETTKSRRTSLGGITWILPASTATFAEAMRRQSSPVQMIWGRATCIDSRFRQKRFHRRKRRG